MHIYMYSPSYKKNGTAVLVIHVLQQKSSLNLQVQSLKKQISILSIGDVVTSSSLTRNCYGNFRLSKELNKAVLCCSSTLTLQWPLVTSCRNAGLYVLFQSILHPQIRMFWFDHTLLNPLLTPQKITAKLLIEIKVN